MLTRSQSIFESLFFRSKYISMNRIQIWTFKVEGARVDHWSDHQKGQLCFILLLLFKLFLFTESGMYWTWYVLNLVCTEPCMYSFVLNLVCTEPCMYWTLYVLNLVCTEPGMYWSWYVLNLVSTESGKYWIWYVLNLVCTEPGMYCLARNVRAIALKLTGSSEDKLCWSRLCLSVSWK